MNLLLTDTQYGIRIHLYQHLLIGMTPADTGTGYIMCLWCQTLRHKHFVTGFYHSGIIHIYILYKKPGTNAVLGQMPSLCNQLQNIIIQQQTGLIFRVGRPVRSRTTPQMAVSPM